MISPLSISGAFVVEGIAATDERGAFRKLIDAIQDSVPAVFRTIDEVALSHTSTAGTIRGLHFQVDPHAQTKMVSVAAGAVRDVLVDLRVDSPSYGRSESIELDSAAAVSILVPTGVAHGFQTLVDDTTVLYVMHGAYHQESARVLAFDDPTLAIAWPLPVTNISPADRNGLPWPVS